MGQIPRSDLSSSQSKLINPYKNSNEPTVMSSDSDESLQELKIKLNVSKQILAKMGGFLSFMP